MRHRLRLKIRVPYQNLAGHVARLQRLQLASDVLRRTSRFVILARRLEVQMAELDKVPTTTHTNGPSTPTKERNRTPISYSTDDAGEGDRERGIAKAALTIAELGINSVSILRYLFDLFVNNFLVTLSSEAEDVSEDGSGPIPLKSINAVSRLLPSIEASRVKVTSDMEAMVQTGLQTLVGFQRFSSGLYAANHESCRINPFWHHRCKLRLTYRSCLNWFRTCSRTLRKAWSLG
jgi:hypothetical protein